MAMSSSSLCIVAERSRSSSPSNSSRSLARSLGKRASIVVSWLSSRVQSARSSSCTALTQPRHGGSSCRMGRFSGCVSMCSSSSMGGIGNERWLPSQSRAASSRYWSGYALSSNGFTALSSLESAAKASLMRRPVLTSARFSTRAPTTLRENEATRFCTSAEREAASIGTAGPRSDKFRSVCK